MEPKTIDFFFFFFVIVVNRNFGFCLRRRSVVKWLLTHWRKFALGKESERLDCESDSLVEEFVKHELKTTLN